MINELVAAAKEPLGLRSIWIEDEEYEAIINAVLAKLSSLGLIRSGAVPAGWSIEVDGARVCVTKPDGSVSEWSNRPKTNGSGMYDLCRALVGAD